MAPIDLTTSLLDKAIASSIVDFEAAVQFFSAAYSEADYIITRNARHFPQDMMPVLSPPDFLALLH